MEMPVWYALQVSGLNRARLFYMINFTRTCNKCMQTSCECLCVCEIVKFGINALNVHSVTYKMYPQPGIRGQKWILFSLKFTLRSFLERILNFDKIKAVYPPAWSLGENVETLQNK